MNQSQPNQLRLFRSFGIAVAVLLLLSASPGLASKDAVAPAPATAKPELVSRVVIRRPAFSIQPPLAPAVFQRTRARLHRAMRRNRPGLSLVAHRLIVTARHNPAIPVHTRVLRDLRTSDAGGFNAETTGAIRTPFPAPFLAAIG